MSKDNKIDPNDLKKNILNATISHPMTMFPTGVGFLSALGFALLGGGPAVAYLAGTSVAVGAGAWCYNYFFQKNHFTQKYVQQLQNEMRKKREEILDDLGTNLQTMAKNNSGEAKEHAQQCLEQLRMSQEKYAAYLQLLDRKLVRGELTYSRFLVAGEQTFLGLLDNLNKVVEIFASISAIDLAYVDKQLLAIRKQKILEDADVEEKKQLERRKDLYAEGLSEINKYITENEKALTIINESMFSISKVQMMKGQADAVELNETLQNLQDLAEQSEEYSVKTKSTAI